ncbi:glyoxylate/hydroxypyruvate reductase A [Roseibium hamelinense]|uniref:Glyoxylate/hydroxypyruvate reductase A n=1 Tax=Roseibium hamelinense TaxID=150831 RepID=A0A562SLZ2_9HYPH|nr:glyoxylate/hydroxypyruvate reductase A [Roseibium hamelinense]MTI42253.1 glyoxylate/hydroxypyruvate reductase A [Roseibium hamelinense]TWI82148.1 glyoxylate/hydroxypyruvate reductase A [Roseibium hamelinense]
MTLVIPFISSAGGQERQAWKTALPEALDGIGIVKPFSDLSAPERQAATIAIVANPDSKEVAALPNLKWVHSLWAGVERLAKELPEDGPMIVRLVDPQMAETMSEAVLAWSLFLHRDMPCYGAQQRRSEWIEHELKLPEERRIGILGLGNLGQRSALRLRANGFPVSGWSRSEKHIEGLETHAGSDGLDTVLGQSDILVVLVPLTAETAGLVDSRAFSKLPRGAALINFSRGPVLNDGDLLKALDSGHLSHAVLDVFDQEPLPQKHPFWLHEKITVLPHISAPTVTRTAVRIVAQNISRYLQTGELPETVDRGRGY